jgi:hypothetical protein
MTLVNRSPLLPLLGFIVLVVMVFSSIWLADLAAIAHATRPGLKVLYTTGFTRDTVVRRAALDPAEALLGKPFTIDQPTLKVRLVLDGGVFDPPAR